LAESVLVEVAQVDIAVVAAVLIDIALAAVVLVDIVSVVVEYTEAALGLLG
jgi:hypothetical protein